jgi:hypothetical protein
MAKYGRFDPRNKKNGRNKSHSLNRDIRIKDSEKDVRKKKPLMVSWTNVEEEDNNDEE